MLKGKKRWWILGPVLVLLVPIVVYAPFLAWEYTRGQPEPVPGTAPVSTKDAPWVVVIGNPATHPDTPSHKLCVGTLVAPKAVVTAAHCLGRSAPADLTVTAGRDDLRGNAGKVVRVAATWLDPRYHKGLAEESFTGGMFHEVTLAPADIGVITLAEPVDTPVLPLAGPGDHLAGAAAAVYGWRMSPDDEPVLWQAPTAVAEDAECVRRAAEGVRFIPPRWHGVRYDPASYLCVGAERAIRLRATDSGSPVVVGGKLAGVASWSGSASPSAPDYYTRVSSFRAELLARIHTTG